ncbi:TetR family transcriptional regulator [Verrucomicrobia bacterium LW23]|nr:TetR family transcriptional regulator [Verrucomicrobia bacterium LW23]
MGTTRKSTTGTSTGKKDGANTAAIPDSATVQPKTLGRKRDASRNKAILDATLEVLAEIGFDSMTMDLVAARAGAGKATLYRRWPSKGEVVRDALIGMSRNSIEVDHLPDTGNLRDDLLAVMKPPSLEYSERKLRVLAGLGSFSTQHRKLYDEALTGIFEPWIRINTELMQRAIERRELPAGADIPLACEIIISLTTFRTSTQLKKFDRASYAALLDHFVLPGLAIERRNPNPS